MLRPGAAKFFVYWFAAAAFDVNCAGALPGRPQLCFCIHCLPKACSHRDIHAETDLAVMQLPKARLRLPLLPHDGTRDFAVV